MKALVLEKKLHLSLRDIKLPTEVNSNDVKIKKSVFHFRSTNDKNVLISMSFSSLLY